MPGAPSRKGPIAQIADKLAARPDSEHELTLSRLALSLLAFICLFIGLLSGGIGHQVLLEEIGLYFLLYTAATVLLFIHLLFWPGVSVMRRMIGIPLDIFGVAYLMHTGDELTAFTYPIFLWAIFGNGFRFGVEYLFVAAIVGFIGFLGVIVTTPFWYQNRELSGGLLAGLIILPIYVSVLIRRLSEAKRQAEEASRAKSLFLASISHELRTPLNAVIGLADVLVGTPLKREQADMARTIGKSGRSLLSLINSLLDVSRMELGKKPQMGAFDLHGLLRDIRSMLSVQAQAKGIGLGLHIDPALPRHVVGSTAHFEEVLINLAGNAVKFTAQGYVLIEARLLSAEANGPIRLRFEVNDTGIGIAPEAQARIFDSFTQADETIIDRFGGTGLGLSIARQLVEAHGGRIGVESVPGAGSTFWFEIEVGAGATEAEPDASAVFAFVLSRDSGLVESVRASCCPTSTIGDMADLAAYLATKSHRNEILLIDERMIETEGQALFDLLESQKVFSMRTCLLLSTRPDDVPQAWRRHVLATLPLPLAGESLRQMVRLGASAPNARALVSTPEADLPLRALDILVAEDNRTNQMVIAQILTRGGHRATIVENGDLAVNALLQGSFDLVLMDVNMPVMNGLDASKFYQFAMLGQNSVPIIALTADATPETALKCREAGMIECINKPIEALKLLALVDKHAAPARAAMPDMGAPAPEALAESDAICTDAIDARALRDLEALGGEAFVCEIATQFVADAAGVLQKLVVAVAEQDVTGFRDHAHALRSCAANVGAQAVYKLCLDLRAIEAQDLVVSGVAHVRELEAQFARARTALLPHLR